MLAYSASEDDHTSLLRRTRKLVQVSDVFYDVDDEAWVAEGVEVDHVPE